MGSSSSDSLFLVIDQLFEEEIKIRLMEVHDWETMQPQCRWKQQEWYALESIAALKQLALVPDGVEPSPQENWEAEEPRAQQQIPVAWDKEQLPETKISSSSQSFDSISACMELIQQIEEIERSHEVRQTNDVITRKSI